MEGRLGLGRRGRRRHHLLLDAEVRLGADLHLTSATQQVPRALGDVGAQLVDDRLEGLSLAAGGTAHSSSHLNLAGFSL